MIREMRFGTRGSDLALAQTDLVMALLGRLESAVALRREIIQTTGDAIVDRPLPAVGGKGLFTLQLEEALLTGKIEAAVHSLKDLPTEIDPRLTLAAILEREDPSEALVSRGRLPLQSLPSGARVGTSSPRRAAQLLAKRPDLRLVEIRGNVPTRIAKVERGDCDATLLARAGMARLGLLDHAAEIIPPAEFLPAPGQGAIAVQARTEDAEVLRLLAKLDHLPTRLATMAERAVLARLEGGCHLPVATWARVVDGRMRLDALVASPTGSPAFRASRTGEAATGTQAIALGLAVAEELLASGAGSVLPALSPEAPR